MARKTLATYDASRVIVTLGGYVLDGFAKGTFIKVTTPTRYTYEAGVEAGARAKNVDVSGQVELTFLQTSDAHGKLHTLLTSDRGGNGAVPLIIKDFSGTFLMTATTAWVEKEPDYEMGDTISSWSWTIAYDSAEIYAAGN